MKTLKWLVITFAAAVAAGGLFTYQMHAAGPWSGAGPWRGAPLEKVKTKLNLTDEQVAKLREILSADRETIAALLTRMHQARKDLRTTIQAPGATEKSVRAAAANLAAVESDAAVERLRLFGNLSPMLTAKQREQLSEFQAQRDEFVQGLIQRAGGGPAE